MIDDVMIVPPISNVLLSSWGSPHEHEMRRSRSGPLHPRSARSRFVEHSNPAHANPTAQILTSGPQTYNRPQTPVHRQDKSAAQPVYCYADKRAQRSRPEELDRGYAPLRGLQRQQHCGGTGATADLRRLWNGGGPAPTHPKEEGGAHSAQPNAYPLYNYTTPILVLYMFMLSNFHTELGFSVRCAR
jgi:hypothetical protein